MKRALWLLPLPLLAAWALLPAATRSGEKVVFAFDNRITSVELLIGIERGYFAAEGIDVEVATFNGTTESVPLLARGALDVAPTGAFGSAYINAMQRGARVRLVAARAVHRTGVCDYTTFVARPGLVESGELSDFASVRGKRIMVDRTSSQFFYVSRLLDLGGLAPEDVELVALPHRMAPEALSRGVVDLAVGTEPGAHRIVTTGSGTVWRPFSDVAPDQQSTFLMFGPRLLDRRRDLGHKVMRAWRRAVDDYVREGKSDRNVALVAKLTRMPEADVRELCWPQWATDGRVDPVSLQRVQEYAFREGLISRISPLSELVDEGFLESP